MFRDPSVAGDWSALVRRLDAAGALTRWGSGELALQGVGSVEELPEHLTFGREPDRKDAILGALVRVGAADGGGDADAVLVVLHLLSEGVTTLASRIRDLSDDSLHLAAGELAAQVRGFPWRRRRRAVAANLLLDTRAALMRELLPRHPEGRRGVELVDPGDPRLAVRADGGTDDLRLVDLIGWAADCGVIAVEDGRLLLALADVGAPLNRQSLAARSAVTVRTLRRRRARAVTALREARFKYLEAVA